MQLGQGLDLDLDLQKQSGRERGCSGDKESIKGPGKENPQSQKPGRALVAMSCCDFFILSEREAQLEYDLGIPENAGKLRGLA
jgi:hypothetical protein